MEINTIGTGLGVFKYLETGNRRYLRRVRDDSADFRRFHDQYQRLARTAYDRRLENAWRSTSSASPRSGTA